MNVYLPGSLSELWSRQEECGMAQFFAGGTDLFVKLRASAQYPRALIGLEAVRELRSIEEREGAIFVGAGASHTRLLSHPLIQAHFPLLAKALRVLGSPPVRNMGTIGGNICTASPAGDALPPLYALGAEVELRRRDRSRRLPIHEFILGPGKTALAENELLYGVWLKKDDSPALFHFEKVGPRKALAIAIASFAALINSTDAGIVKKARFAWGSVGPVVVTSREAEESLVGFPLTRESLQRIVPIVDKIVSPIDDVRASASYRRALAGNLVLRLAEYGPREMGGKGEGLTRT
ncbi:MAG TPA: FAD binding domain-containing protein [Syntrophorhabdaceae bacterium]|jgi:xanthine dehydrogenase FAD-binding subunit